jgi:adenylate kinase family enzyme
MNKICIVGCGGSGKSTLAAKLGEVTGIPVYHLDVYFWNLNDWIYAQTKLVENDKWIMDGNFNGTQRIRFDATDTIIYLDLPRYKCLYNAFKRMIVYKRKRRPDMAEGCNEKFDLSFYKWIWGYKKNHGKQTKERLELLKDKKNVIILKSFKEMDKFVGTLRTGSELRYEAGAS